MISSATHIRRINRNTTPYTTEYIDLSTGLSSATAPAGLRPCPTRDVISEEVCVNELISDGDPTTPLNVSGELANTQRAKCITTISSEVVEPYGTDVLDVHVALVDDPTTQLTMAAVGAAYVGGQYEVIPCPSEDFIDTPLYVDWWTPSNPNFLSNFWYDGADETTITAAGNEVKQMLDKSGNNYTLAPILTSPSPRTQTRVLNGLNVIEWTGDNCLETPFNHVQANDPLNIAYIVYHDVPGDDENGLEYHWSGTDTTAAGKRLATRKLDPSPPQPDRAQILGGDGTANKALGTNSAFPIQAATIVVTQINGANSALRINGTLENTGDLGDVQFIKFTLGHSAAEAGNLDGYLAEVIGFEDTAKQEVVEGYLAWKWGIVNTLPLNHPYKLRQPYWSE